MDRVFVHNLSIHGKHGVLDFERHTEQEFVLDIEAEFDSAPSAKSDKLGDTIDYIAFVKIATDIIQNRSHYLIERVAHEIADRILADTSIAGVRITIQKPAVLESGIAGITIERKRP